MADPTDNLKSIEEWTDKERLFVEMYFVWNLNGTKAAIAAKYSKKSARQIASENLSKPYIRAEIDRRLKLLAMGADEVLARLAQQGRGDMRDFIGLTPTQLAKHPDGNLIKKIEHTIEGTGESREEKIKVELYDAQAALNLIGRHHKLFTDKHEHTGKDGEQLIIAVTKMDVDEL